MALRASLGVIKKMKKTFIDLTGKEQNYKSAVALMDDELREEVHGDLAPCTNQEFIEEYAKRHEVKFSEEFAPYVGSAW